MEPATLLTPYKLEAYSEGYRYPHMSSVIGIQVLMFSLARLIVNFRFAIRKKGLWSCLSVRLLNPPRDSTGDTGAEDKH
jgi:hypothetical protein